MASIKHPELLRDKLLSHCKIVGKCWIWTGGVSGNGYGVVGLNDGPKQMGAHKLSYILFVGEVPNGLEVCHTCDTPACFNPKHLFLGTPKQNSEDSVAKGRNASGPRNGNSKLTTRQILDIRKRRRNGEKLQPLADEYGVSPTQISNIARKIQRRLS